MRRLYGVQAQDAAQAALAIRLRASSAAGDVERALVKRSVVRTWAMRGTIHIMTLEDVLRLLPLVGPPAIRSSSRRYAELGLSEEVCAKAVVAVRETLGEHGPMTRRGISSHLAKSGIPVEGQAPYHLLRRAALEGVVRFGPDLDGAPSYTLMETAGPPPKDGAANRLGEMAVRYLRAYGPADQADLAAWSGLPMKQARAAFEMAADGLDEVDVAGSRSWMPKGRAGCLEDQTGSEPVVRLLPSFDPYLLGYRRRDLGVRSDFVRRVHPGGGVMRPTLLVDGRAAGTWAIRRVRGRAAIQVSPFEVLPAKIAEAVGKEAEDVGRFLGTEAPLRVEAPVRLATGGAS